MESDKNKFSNEKFNVFVRYIMRIAIDKRCVMYSELEDMIGLDKSQVIMYSKKLIDYCIYCRMPFLNSLILGSSTCEPIDGFSWYETHCKKSWGEVISECWASFHMSVDKSNYCEANWRDKNIANFLAESNNSL